MKTNELLVSNLNISEDSYDYKGLFTLSGNGTSLDLELIDMENNEKITKIKNTFNLEEDTSDIKKILMDKVISKSNISSKINEGEDYSAKEGKAEFDSKAKSLDRA